MGLEAIVKIRAISTAVNHQFQSHTDNDGPWRDTQKDLLTERSDCSMCSDIDSIPLRT